MSPLHGSCGRKSGPESQRGPHIGSVTGKQKIVVFLKQALIVAIVCVATIYVCDYLWVRYRVAHQTSNNPFDVVPVQSVIAIPLKGGKTEYDIDQAQTGSTQACVHSLFSHYGYAPCWYVERENRNPIPMIILP